MATKKYVSLDKLSLYDEKIKKFLADADTAALASAKEYAESLGTNYDKAGAAATVQGKLDEEVIRAKAREDEVAAAAAQAQSEVDALETYVGTLPTGSAATSVVDYVNVKTAGIATDAALGELSNQVTGLQGVVNGITADYLKAADKQELSDAIAAEAARADAAEKKNAADIKAIADDYLKAADAETLQANIDAVAEDVAEIAEDYLKAADKTELQGKIDAKADKTALDAEKERAEAAEAGLQTQINTIMNNPDAEGAINSINEFTAYVAEHGTIADGMRADINKNKDDIAAEVKRAGEAEAALDERLDVLEAIEHDAYIAADTALKNELNAEIAKKADSTAVDAVVEDIAELREADAGIIERVAAVEAQLGDGEGSVTDLIADAVAGLQAEMATAIEGAKTDASNKDAVVLAEAQKAATAVQTALDAHTGNADIHVTAADKVKWNAAADVTAKAHEHSNLEVLEGINADKVAAWDAAEGNAKTYADGLNTAMNTRVVALEAWHENFVECSQEDINALFTA